MYMMSKRECVYCGFEAGLKEHCVSRPMLGQIAEGDKSRTHVGGLLALGK